MIEWPVVAIEDDDALYRRVMRYYVKDDGRISSAAFKVKGKWPDHEISVEIARLSSPEACATRNGDRGFRVVSLTARAARAIGFEVVHDPLTDCYPHALIRGENDQDRSEQLAFASRPVL